MKTYKTNCMVMLVAHPNNLGIEFGFVLHLQLYWSAVSTHRDEANFEDVMRFDPSRFEGVGPRPFTFVPFRGGLRMCFRKEFSRLEVLVFLHNIVTTFKWDLLIPDEKIEYDPMATPVKGVPVRLHPHQVQ